MFNKLMVGVVAIVAMFAVPQKATAQICCSGLPPWEPTGWEPYGPIIPPSGVFPVDGGWSPWITVEPDLEFIKEQAVNTMQTDCISCVTVGGCSNPFWLTDTACVDEKIGLAEQAMSDLIRAKVIEDINKIGLSPDNKGEPLFHPDFDITQFISRPQTSQVVKFIGEMADLTLRATITIKNKIIERFTPPDGFVIYRPTIMPGPVPHFDIITTDYTTEERECNIVMLFGYDTSGHWQDLNVDGWILPQPMWQFSQNVRGIWISTMIQAIEDASNTQILSNPYILSSTAFAAYRDEIATQIEDAAALAETAMFARNVTNGISACIADWDTNGGVDGSDIGAFYTSWDNGEADVNQDGGTDNNDVTAFFECWDDSHCFYENGYAYY
jgi:hypothetical protein